MRLARIARTAAIVSAVAGHDRLVWRSRTMTRKDATSMPRGCRPAELYEYNLGPISPLPWKIHTYRPCDNYLPAFFRLEILSDPV